MDKAPRSIRTAIAIVGRTNAGKSSLINAITEQAVSITSEVAGTTTDSVGKAYELIGYGPVMFYDTAGLDDDSQLGQPRMQATMDRLKDSDMALVVIGDGRISEVDERVIGKIKTLAIPYLVVFNKSDLFPMQGVVSVSAVTGENIKELKQAVISILPEVKEKTILEGIVEKGDKVVLVCPIDSAAPKGRLILPQVQTIRELLDLGALAVSVQPSQIPEALELSPKLVITDSQVVKEVDGMLPTDVSLTTFSILFGRLKGDYHLFMEGAKAIDGLQDGDRILIAEACSHTTTEDDIARKKLPLLLQKYTGKSLRFEFSQGRNFPKDMQTFKLVLHCGSCMLTNREMNNRLELIHREGVPVTNYGMAISKCQGVLDRVTKIF